MKKSCLPALAAVAVAALSGIAASGCRKPEAAAPRVKPSARPVLLLRERWYTLRFPAEWNYTYRNNKTTVELFSKEAAEERRTWVLVTAVLPKNADSVRKVETLFQGHVRELRPHATFTTTTRELAGVTATETRAPSVRFRDKDGYRFRYITVPAEKGHFFLSVGIYQPDDQHQEEIERLLRSLQLSDGSPLPPLPEKYKGLKRVPPAHHSR